MRILIEARNRSVAVEDGLVVEPGGAYDVVLAVPRGEVRPGLINAHDHLHRNHYGRLGNPPYRNAYDWARDIQARHRDCIARGRRMPRRDAMLAGAWKNLCAGVTTVLHHDPWEVDFEGDFPLRVVQLVTADSLGMSPLLPVGAGARLGIHLAEGVDAAATGEVRALEAMGLLTPRLVAVHGVGMDRDGIARFRRAGAALVWCPSSNLFLFGRTASPELLREGVDILLGSDSFLTGAGDLLDELRCARQLRLLSDQRLEDAVGRIAARRLGLPMPALEPGAAADLVILSRPLLEASAEDVLLVMVDGVVRVAAPGLVPALGALAAPGRIRRIGSTVRWTSDAGGADRPPSMPWELGQTGRRAERGEQRSWLH